MSSTSLALDRRIRTLLRGCDGTLPRLGDVRLPLIMGYPSRQNPVKGTARGNYAVPTARRSRYVGACGVRAVTG